MEIYPRSVLLSEVFRNSVQFKRFYDYIKEFGSIPIKYMGHDSSGIPSDLVLDFITYVVEKERARSSVYSKSLIVDLNGLNKARTVKLSEDYPVSVRIP